MSVATISLFDTVTDSQDVAVPNATVTLTFAYNQATTADGLLQPSVRQTTTDSTGKFTFAKVIPNDLISPSNTVYLISIPAIERSYEVAPQSGNGSSQQSTAANVIVNNPLALAPYTVIGPVTITGPLTVPSGGASITGGLTVAAGETGIDTIAAGALLIADNTATSVEAGSGATPFALQGDVATRSLTVLPTGPYTSTAVAGGADYSKNVRMAGPDPWFDVTHPAYGAKGDGTTNDTAAIQLAINAAHAVTTGLGVVMFPNGNFLISTALTTYANVSFLTRGGTITGAGSTSVTPWLNGAFNVRDYGAKLDGATDDTTSIQNAINAAVANIGTVLIPNGNAKITAALSVSMTVVNKGITICGISEGYSTITQATAGADIFQLGTTSAEAGDDIRIRDLALNGGRYGLNLNNCLHGIFERLTIGITGGQTSNIFLQGQNESHIFRNLQLLLASGPAIDGNGNLNGGGAGGPLNSPETSKSQFTHIRVYGSTGTYAVNIDAGSLGGQQTSLELEFDHIICESNTKGSLRFGHVSNTTVRHLSNEDNIVGNNTYTGVLLDTGVGTVKFEACFLAGTRAGVTYKYGMDHTDGILTLIGCMFGSGGGAATADLHLAGIGATVINCSITDIAHLVVATSTTGAKSVFLNLTDTSGLPLAAPGASLNAVGVPGTNGFGTLQLVKDLRRSVQVPSFATPLTIDATAGEEVEIAYTSSFTLNAPTNAVQGQVLTLRLTHDNTAGAYVITWNAVFKRAGGAFANTNSANAQDTITFMYNSSAQWEEIGRAINIS